MGERKIEGRLNPMTVQNELRIMTVRSQRKEIKVDWFD